jgi:hypothetical protein
VRFDALSVALIGAALSSAVLAILPGIILIEISGFSPRKLQWANSVFALMVLATLWAVSRVGGKG